MIKPLSTVRAVSFKYLRKRSQISVLTIYFHELDHSKRFKAIKKLFHLRIIQKLQKMSFTAKIFNFEPDFSIIFYLNQFYQRCHFYLSSLSASYSSIFYHLLLFVSFSRVKRSQSAQLSRSKGVTQMLTYLR